MSQHDYIIDNQLAPAFRSDLNLALAAIVSTNSGATAPAAPYANMLWYDSANDLLKMRNEANSAWITLGIVNQTLNQFVASVATGSGNSGEILMSGGSGVVPSWTSSLTGGFTTTADNDGTFSSGTYTPTPVGGNMKSITNGGAFTFAAPTVAGDYTMVIQITNNATAGAITLSGFTRTIGDPFTTSNGSDFFVNITKCNGFILANTVALQ
jgi:hypothetical protein